MHTWLSKHAQLINRSKEDFIQHNKNKYGLPLAIWVACEVWDFGAMSTLFKGMREEEQDLIAQQYGVQNGRTFASWLRSLNYLRNVCAHHSRLWNRNIVEQPSLPKSHEVAWVSLFENNTHAQARCGVLLFICNQLMREINPKSSWFDRMLSHLNAFPDLNHLNLNVQGMGLIGDWQHEWQEIGNKKPLSSLP